MRRWRRSIELVAPDRNVRYLEHVPGRSLLVQYGRDDVEARDVDGETPDRGELVAVVDVDATHAE